MHNAPRHKYIIFLYQLMSPFKFKHVVYEVGQRNSGTPSSCRLQMIVVKL